MATPATSTINWNDRESVARLFALVDKRLRDTVFNKNVLLQFLDKRKKTYNGGTYVSVNLEYDDTAQGGASSGLMQVTPQDGNIMTRANWSPAHYYEPMTITEHDLLDCQGEDQVLDLVEARTKNQTNKLRKTMTADIFAGDGTSDTQLTTFVGLQNAYAITGTYGGIAKGTYAWWQSAGNNSTVTLDSLTLDNLQTGYGLASDGDETPDLGVTTQTIWDKIWSMATAKQKLGVSKLAELGFVNIEFNGVPIVVDKACTAGYFFWINSNTTYLVSHKRDNFKTGQFLKSSGQPFASMRVLSWTGALVCDNPRRNYMFSALSSS